eukprot:scaffold23402_cov125-Isochrysis_galbana.AAC.6
MESSIPVCSRWKRLVPLRATGSRMRGGGVSSSSGGALRRRTTSMVTSVITTQLPSATSPNPTTVGLRGTATGATAAARLDPCSSSHDSPLGGWAGGRRGGGDKEGGGGGGETWGGGGGGGGCRHSLGLKRSLPTRKGPGCRRGRRSPARPGCARRSTAAPTGRAPVQATAAAAAAAVATAPGKRCCGPRACRTPPSADSAAKYRTIRGHPCSRHGRGPYGGGRSTASCAHCTRREGGGGRRVCLARVRLESVRAR